MVRKPRCYRRPEEPRETVEHLGDFGVPWSVTEDDLLPPPSHCRLPNSRLYTPAAPLPAGMPLFLFTPTTPPASRDAPLSPQRLPPARGGSHTHILLFFCIQVYEITQQSCIGVRGAGGVAPGGGSGGGTRGAVRGVGRGDGGDDGGHPPNPLRLPSPEAPRPRAATRWMIPSEFKPAPIVFEFDASG